MAAPTPPINMLFIGEPLNESVGIKLADGKIVDIESKGQFAGDIAPNMAAYAGMAANAMGKEVDIEVFTGVGGEGDQASIAVLSDLQRRGCKLHPMSARINGKTLGSIINLLLPEGGPHPDKVKLDRAESAFREVMGGFDRQKIKEIVSRCDFIVVSGIPLACVKDKEKFLMLLEEAKAKKPAAKVVISTNLRFINWKMPSPDFPEGISDDGVARAEAIKWQNRMLSHADIIFANAKDENQLRGDSDAAGAISRLLGQARNKDATIILTNDEQPINISYVSGSMRKTEMLRIHATDSVVDTVGAGDSLAATTLIAQLAGYNDIITSVRLGTYVASQVVGIKGALPPVGQTLSFEPPFAVMRDGGKK